MSREIFRLVYYNVISAMPYCNTNCMNVFLEELYRIFPNDKIILVCDGAAWHKSGALKIPENIEPVLKTRSFKLFKKLLTGFAILSAPYLNIL